MKESRNLVIAETLKWEGGYTNHPSDPGGPTNWGITLADAKKYWKKNATATDVKNMPKDIAIDIYRSKYWKTPYYDCDKLEAGVDLAVFDFGVNSGPERAKRYLDAAVGGDAQQTINRLCDARMKFLQGLAIWPAFGKGWTNRVKGIRSKAIQMASEPSKPPAVEGGIIAAILGALAASWEFVKEHPIEIGLGAAATAAILVFLVRRYKKWKKNNAGKN